MTLAHNSNEYYVDNFLSLQKDLSTYLGEAHNIDGEWTVAEKKRFINKGCVAVAAMTMTTHKNTEWDIVGTTAKPLRTITVPDAMIKPKRLFIDGNEYLQLDLDNFLKKLGSSIAGTPSTSSNLAQLEQLNRFFYWNEGANTFDMNPPITETVNAVLYMVAMPRLLEKDGDISVLHPAWAYLAPVWAAMMMLDKDEEHRDRGETARRRWLAGLKAFERFKHRGVGNKATRMIKDPEKFSKRNVNAGDNGIDWGTAFDRLP